MRKKEHAGSARQLTSGRLNDLRFADITLDSLPRLKKLREGLLASPARVCIERARLITQHLRDAGASGISPAFGYAGAVRHALINKRPFFFDDSLVAGSTCSTPFSAPVYPEFTGLLIWPELDTISTRARNPQLLDPCDARELDRDIFPFWMDRTILESTRRKFNNPPCLRLFEKLVYYIAGKSGCLSHTIPFYRTVIESGTDALCNRAAESIALLEARGDERTAEQIEFYRSVDMVLEGIAAYAENLSKKAMELSLTNCDPMRRAELNRLANVCSRVPRLGASTLEEAVNSLWILHVGIHVENINMAMSPGRLDQILYPYYKADLEKGKIDAAGAIELIGCLWLKFNDNTCLVPETSEELFGGAGTVPAVTIGGVDELGNDAVNDCTYLILRIAELLETRDPSLNARYYASVNTKNYRNRVAEVIAATRCIPAVYNDQAAIRTLCCQGIALPHARDYAIIGCVELASAGRSYDASSSLIVNLPAVIELTLFNGKRPSVSGQSQIGPLTGDPHTAPSFEQLWVSFTGQLTWMIGQAIELNGYFGEVHRIQQPSPLLSALFDGPLDSGKDLISGGARYNSSGATHIGFADTVDSLCALQRAVFDEKYCTMDEMISALNLNFKGNETLRAYLVNKTPKFGTDHPLAVAMSKRLAEFLFNFYQRHTNDRGGRYRPAYWTMTNHAGQGMFCGALPSGRMAGESFASGMTPVAGAAPELTTCLRAVAAIDCRYIPGGMALNLKYPTLEKQQDVLRLAECVEAYFSMGGMHIQFNIMTKSMLLDAKKHPYKYPNLLVRVSGYSAYFSDLTPRMQDEIISRTSYGIDDGSAKNLHTGQKEEYAAHSKYKSD
jgi:pyruvate formate-lyase/glycerol dehydratase family glycyl radical enzyme